MGRPKGSKNKVCKKIHRTCIMCGKDFLCFPYKIFENRGKFCSLSCKYKYGHTEKSKNIISKKSKGRPAWNKGQRIPSIQAEKNGHWICGRVKDKDGYILSYVHNGHPFGRGRNKNYVLEHRLIMEKHLGRFLHPQEVVHHINEVRSDNYIDNLMLFPNQIAHRKYHRAIK